MNNLEIFQKLKNDFPYAKTEMPTGTSVKMTLSGREVPSWLLNTVDEFMNFDVIDTKNIWINVEF